MASNKQRGLGRDLESLLGKRRSVSPVDDSASSTQEPSGPSLTDATVGLKQLPIDLLQSGQYQPRQDMAPDALEDLANSIRTQGIIQPLVVRSIGNKQYEIVAGERRWRAAQLAGLSDVPVIIRDIDDETASAVALIENVQREDLNPMEESRAYHRLTDEFSLTHQEVADLVGKSRTAISNLLRLMNLNNDVKRFLENGDIEMGHARALLALESHKQSEVARTIIAKSLTVREAENLIRRLQKPSTAQTKNNSLDPDTRRLQERLAETLGAKVSIQHSAKGKGKLVINYTSLDELDGILAHIK